MIVKKDMIVKKELMTYSCDGCGTMLDNENGYEFFEKLFGLTEAMKDEGWISKNGKWYCPKCAEKIINNK